MSDINEIKRIVTESRVHGVYNWNLETIASLITTIESQNDKIAFLEGSLHFHRTRDTAIEITKKDALIESQKEEIEKIDDILLGERQAMREWKEAFESQKEEIDRLQKPALSLAYRVLKEKHERDADAFSEYTNGLEAQIESLKAITELTVNALKQISRGDNMARTARDTLSEIERLQNV